MRTWTREQLESLRSSNDLHVAPFREDGRTPGTPTWVWSVVIDDGLFVRSSNPASRWFAAAVREGAGRASAGGYTGGAWFEPVEDEQLKDRVDEAFRDKYGGDGHFSEDLLARSRHQIARVGPDQPARG